TVGAASIAKFAVPAVLTTSAPATSVNPTLCAFQHGNASVRANCSLQPPARPRVLQDFQRLRIEVGGKIAGVQPIYLNEVTLFTSQGRTSSYDYGGVVVIDRR